MIEKFVPDDFEVPAVFETGILRLRMLSVHDAEKDYEAVMTSRDHIRSLYPEEVIRSWPEENMTLEEDLEDLERHQSEFLERKAFAYTVVSLDESKCLGCVYIDPSTRKGFEAEITMWARSSELGTGLEDCLRTTIKKWIKEKWPFKEVAYPGFEIEWSRWVSKEKIR